MRSIKRFVVTSALLAVLMRLATAETCLSPYVKKLTDQEHYLYVWTLGMNGQNDRLVVIDVNPKSKGYGTVLNIVDVGSKGNEVHHFGYTDDRTRIFGCGLELKARMFIFDVKKNPAKPELMQVIEGLPKVTGGLASPHTAYALPGMMRVTFLSDKNGGVPTGFADFTNRGKFVRTVWLPKNAPYGYDIKIKPELGVMVTSSFTPYRNFSKPMDKLDIKDFGDTLVFWDYRKLKVLQVAKVGKAPLEVRWALNPGRDYGFVNCALDDSIWMWRRTKKGKFEVKRIIKTGKIPVDMRISADDRFLFVSCYADNKVQQWDVSNPAKPKLVSEVKGIPHPNMLHLTWDGKRLYLSNSLLSYWENGKTDYGVWLIRVTEVGMTLDKKFKVDFSKIGRPHDMLLNR